jgi:hypothetical protein
MNDAQDVIRTFLRSKGIIPSPQKDGNKSATHKFDAPAVDPMILNDYCSRNHCGPTKEYMPISWTSPMRHAWNIKVIQLLSAEFKDNVKAGHYQKMMTLPNDQDGQHSVFNIIQRKLGSHQATLQKTSRKRTKAGPLSQLEFDELMLKAETADGLKKRRAERKKNVGHFILQQSLLGLTEPHSCG